MTLFWFALAGVVLLVLNLDTVLNACVLLLLLGVRALLFLIAVLALLVLLCYR